MTTLETVGAPKPLVSKALALLDLLKEINCLHQECARPKLAHCAREHLTVSDRAVKVRECPSQGGEWT